MRLTHGMAVWTMVGCTALWSMAGVVTRHLEQARSFEVTFWRSFFTVVSLLIILPLWQGRVFGHGCLGAALIFGTPAFAGVSCSQPSWWRSL
jgi:drug/metabolite transporter (DMT)-like permease